MKIILFVLLALILSSCSTKWMDSMIREDFDQINVSYYKLAPTLFLPVPKKENCLKISGVSKDLLLLELNKRSSYLSFKECNQNPVLITFESGDDTAVGRNNDAIKLKGMGSQMKGGNTLLGLLFLSAIETESEMVKAKGQVTVKFNQEVSNYPFETEYFETRYVKSDKNPDGRINVEQEVISKTESSIWDKLKPKWEEREEKLKFDVKDDYYEFFRWDLHHESYSKALSKINVLQGEHPHNGDIYFNRAILNEYLRDYPQAERDYLDAMKYNFTHPALTSSLARVKKEILYRESIRKLNPGLLSQN